MYLFLLISLSLETLVLGYIPYPENSLSVKGQRDEKIVKQVP